jgi:hypothetical protein
VPQQTPLRRNDCSLGRRPVSAKRNPSPHERKLTPQDEVGARRT